jgi:hypothetical protein
MNRELIELLFSDVDFKGEDIPLEGALVDKDKKDARYFIYMVCFEFDKSPFKLKSTKRGEWYRVPSEIKNEDELEKLRSVNDSIVNNSRYTTIAVPLDLDSNDDDSDYVITLSNDEKDKLLFLLNLTGIKYDKNPDYSNWIRDEEEAFRDAEAERKDPYGYRGLSRSDFF